MFVIWIVRQILRMVFDKFLEFGVEVVVDLRQMVFTISILVAVALIFLFISASSPLYFTKCWNLQLYCIGPIFFKLSLLSLTEFFPKNLELTLSILRHMLLSSSLD